MTENGKPSGPRVPDRTQWPDAGPVTLKHRIEDMLSDGVPYTMARITEVCGSDTPTRKTSTSRAVHAMMADSLVAELANPDDMKKSVFRWSSFEIENPTPRGPTMPEWMDCDPDIHVVPDNPPGYRVRWARKWMRVRGNAVWMEQPARPMEEISDKELLWWLEDVCAHSGNVRADAGGGGFDKRGGPVTGNEILMHVHLGGGVEQAGMRSMIGRWLGQVRDQYPETIWPPECFVRTSAGYALHPLILDKLKIIAAIPSLMPKGCWEPPADVIQDAVARGSNIFRKRTFVES